MNNLLGKTSVAESRAGLPLLGLASLWAAMVFFVYFSFKTHPLSQVLPFLWKTFDASSFPQAGTQFWKIQGESLRILFTSFVISGATWALGRRVRQWLTLNLPDPWVRLAFDFGLGVCFLNLFWVGTGLERLWFKPLWMTVGVLLSLLFVIDLFKIMKRKTSAPSFNFFPQGASYIFLFLMGLFYWLFSIMQNLAPETFYDSMVYHLAVPSYWLFQHGLRDFPTNFFSNYPYGAETYYLNGLVWQGTEAAKMLHAVSFGICALLAGGWAREIGGEKAGWLTLGLILTLPLIAVNLWTSQVEGFLSLAVVLFIYSLNRFARGLEKPTVWALMAGLFGGLAFSTKYTAILVAGSALLVLTFQKFSLFHKDRWKFWIVMLVGLFLLLGPWVLKNLVYTGNPFFPYLMSHFPGRHLLTSGYEKLLEEQHSRITSEWWSWFLLPWTLTMINPDSYNFCGPIALALTPLLFLFRLRHPALRFLAAVTPLLFIGGFAVTQILRFVLPGFVLFYVLIGAVLAGGDKPVWGKGTALVAALSAVFCFAYLGAISYYYYARAELWSGLQTRAEYFFSQGKVTPYYSLAKWISTNVPADARLLMVGDARGLYYDRPFLTNSVFDEQVLAKIVREEKDTVGIAHRLRELGVDTLVINGSEGIRVSSDYHHYDLTKEEWKRLDDFIQRGTDLNYFQNFQGVYRILPALKESPKVEAMDILLFFSKPASDFVKFVQGRKEPEAKAALTRALELYPFSQTWKNQEKEFESQFEMSSNG